MRAQTKELGTAPIGKLLLKQSLPAIVGMMVIAIYNIVDTIFIGRGVGSLGIAGVAIVLPLVYIIHSLGLAFGMGAASIISRALGRKDKAHANKTYTNYVTLTVGSSIVATVLVALFLGPLLTLFGATETILPYAYDYLLIVLIGLPFFAYAGASSHVIRSEGAAKKAMIVLLSGAVINIILDPILIFGFGMGIKGAALATVIAHIISAGYAVRYFMGNETALKFNRKKLFSWKATKETTIIGSPTLARMFTMNAIAIAINILLAKHGGDLGIAAYGIINRFLIFCFMPIIGLVQGMQPILGYNYGAKKYDRVKKATLITMRAATIISVVGFVIVYAFPEALTRIFTTEEGLVEMTVTATRIVALVFPLIGFQIISGGYYQALGKAKQALFLTLLRQGIIFLPVLLILPPLWGLAGIWWAFPIADVLAALVTGIMIHFALKKLTQQNP